MITNPILNGSFTIDGGAAITLQAGAIDPLDDGKWYEIELNEGNGPLRTRLPIDFINPQTDPVGFVLAVLEEARKMQVTLASNN